MRATVAKARPKPWVPIALRAAATATGLIVATIALALVAGDRVSCAAALALLPSAFLAVRFGTWRIHPRGLRKLGWFLVAADVATLLLLVAGLRSWH